MRKAIAVSSKPWLWAFALSVLGTCLVAPAPAVAQTLNDIIAKRAPIENDMDSVQRAISGSIMLKDKSALPDVEKWLKKNNKKAKDYARYHYLWAVVYYVTDRPEKVQDAFKAGMDVKNSYDAEFNNLFEMAVEAHDAWSIDPGPLNKVAADAAGKWPDNKDLDQVKARLTPTT